MLSQTEYAELAKAYVALSNSHLLGNILSLFRDDAIYQSSATGNFSGREEIGEMMSRFFARYPDVYWQAHNYRSDETGTVIFEFVMQGTSVESGEVISRSGIETIQFDARGAIARLSVAVG